MDTTTKNHPLILACPERYLVTYERLAGFCSQARPEFGRVDLGCQMQNIPETYACNALNWLFQVKGVKVLRPNIGEQKTSPVPAVTALIMLASHISWAIIAFDSFDWAKDTQDIAEMANGPVIISLPLVAKLKPR